MVHPLIHHQQLVFSIAIATASSEKWESIDFKDIQEGIYGGRTLTDIDIRWLLLCIDANNITKSLKFTNCIGITGSGLEPLIGSTVLERIDLSLVGDHDNPNVTPEPPISAAVVLPILESILNTENNSFVHVQLPKKWREERSTLLVQFLERFDSMLNERRFQCSKGCGICEGNDTLTLVDQRRGVITITCYQCMKHLCFGCFEDCDIDFCKCCEKVYCRDCNEVFWCDGCRRDNTRSCKACDVVKNCNVCGNSYCFDCTTWITCETCGDKVCDGIDCSFTCNYDCQKSYCTNCNGSSFCLGPGCIRMGSTQKVSCEDCDKIKYCAQYAYAINENCVYHACEDCATSWIDCQYCSKSYCSIACGHEHVLNICNGEGCKRANCYAPIGGGKYCIEDKALGAECVKRCGCGATFCTDCRVKKCKKSGFDCSDCMESVAPLLDGA